MTATDRTEQDLAGWLREQLDADEWIARGAIRTDDVRNGHWTPAGLQSTYDARVDDHIANWDPARVLAEVEAQLALAVRNEYPFVSEVAGHLVLAGGKRFRPLLTLLAAQFGSPAAAEVVPSAVVVELTAIVVVELTGAIVVVVDTQLSSVWPLQLSSLPLRQTSAAPGLMLLLLSLQSVLLAT